MCRRGSPVDELGLRLGDQPVTVAQHHIHRRRLRTASHPLGDMSPHRRTGADGVAVERQRVHDLEHVPGPLRVAMIRVALGEALDGGASLQGRDHLRGRATGCMIYIRPDGRVRATWQQAVASREPASAGLVSIARAHAAAEPASRRRCQASLTTRWDRSVTTPSSSAIRALITVTVVVASATISATRWRCRGV